MKFKIILMATAILTLNGCSVFMAAQKSGVDVKTLSACRSRSCLISSGATPIQSFKNNRGMIVAEIFQAEAPKGSAARAAMHGVLDFATLGLWEIAGTPIEAVKGQKEIYTVKATYATDGNTIKSMQLVN